MERKSWKLKWKPFTFINSAAAIEHDNEPKRIEEWEKLLCFFNAFFLLSHNYFFPIFIFFYGLSHILAPPCSVLASNWNSFIFFFYVFMQKPKKIIAWVSKTISKCFAMSNFDNLNNNECQMKMQKKRKFVSIKYTWWP